MKKLFFPVFILLSGCQSTTFIQHDIILEDVYVVQPEDDESHPDDNVVHPVDDVDFTLNKNKALQQNIDNVWLRIRQQLTFDIPNNTRIAIHQKRYTKHPHYLNKVAKRAEPFLYYIVEELEKNNVPIELALLPIVESSFDPFAYSSGNAAGMWQFISGTGTRFGMKQNWWYDGRRDIVASTEGAIKYMQYLHKLFDGDWLLALAAYNSGEGRVKRAVNKNKNLGKKTDFWSLELPKETQAYVPKLLALVTIIKDPKKFNIKLYKIINEEVISQVNIGSQLDLAKAASLADISLSELQHLNPGFNRWSTDPQGPHRLVLPKQKVEQFEQNLATLKQSERLTWQRYKIKTGDNLGSIANKFHTHVDLIRQVNEIKGSTIRAGKHLLIPVSAQSLDRYILSQDQQVAKKQFKEKQGIKKIHTVVAGDNLWDIGQRYKVQSRNIARWNGFALGDMLKLGQKLIIWQKASLSKNRHQTSLKTASKQQGIQRKITYKVRSGDSFSLIANKFNIRISDIERWNKLSRNKYLQPGQRLQLSIGVDTI